MFGFCGLAIPASVCDNDKKVDAAEPCRIGGTNMSKVICDVCGTAYPETSAPKYFSMALSIALALET